MFWEQLYKIARTVITGSDSLSHYKVSSEYTQDVYPSNDRPYTTARSTQTIDSFLD